MRQISPFPAASTGSLPAKCHEACTTNPRSILAATGARDLESTGNFGGPLVQDIDLFPSRVKKCSKWCRCAEVLFHPSVLSEIARDVKEKRFLHRFFIATQSPHRIGTWSYELPDGMSSLLAAKVSTRNSPQKRRLFVMSQRNACYIDLSRNRASETSIQLDWLRGLGRHESRRHEMSLDGSGGLVGMKVDTGIGPKTWPSRPLSTSCQDSSTCLVASLVSLESGVHHWPSFLIDDLFLQEPCTGANCFVEVWEGNQDLQDWCLFLGKTARRSTWPAQRAGKAWKSTTSRLKWIASSSLMFIA